MILCHVKLCIALRKPGITAHLIDIVRFFHDNMEAKLRVNGDLLRVI